MASPSSNRLQGPRQAFLEVAPPQEQKKPLNPKRTRNPLLMVSIRVVMNNDDVQQMHQVKQHRRRMKRLDTNEADALDKLIKQLQVTDRKK